ncbi:hypothetical protein [Streptomyces sp. NPDC020681]|uniref:hypothetical protein n=1 Tax=Streptomyces sp. NPDC020681 TaxID=3365083 RepID=UPI003787C322
MTVHQLPVETGVFARYLKGLVAMLDPDGGWYGVFWGRDPEGMRACLEGVEIPPWDVVESLFQDLAMARGTAFAAQETPRARQLHAASAAAYDRQPGGREALAERLELMRRELIYAMGREEELMRRLATEPAGTPKAEQQVNELEWIRDDHARATARVAELRARLGALPDDRAFAEHTRDPGGAPGGHPSSEEWFRPAPEPVRETHTSWPEPAVPDGWFRPQAAAAEPAGERVPPQATRSGPERTDPPAPAAKRKKRRPRGGARFAGVEEEVEDGGVEIVAVPVLPVADDVPRGARYGGAAPAEETPAAAFPSAAAVEEARRAAQDTVAALVRLRSEGRGGEAHAVLCEAAALPAPWLPVLAAELHRAGLEADWATLLWEAASQPVLGLAAAAGALAAAGHTQDSRQLLRQGMARPAGEIAEAVLALEDETRGPEARALLTAFAQLHTAEEVAAIADLDPHRLVPHLLAVARIQSPDHERDLVHALRVAGHLGG